MILSLIPDELHTKCEPVPFGVEDDLRNQIIDSMLESMRFHKAVGLSFNQVGGTSRIAVFSFMPDVMINPYISWQGAQMVTLNETCVSFPGKAVPLKRSAGINVNYFNRKGDQCRGTFHDLQAVCIQHECDHLRGITMMDRWKRQR